MPLRASLRCDTPDIYHSLIYKLYCRLRPERGTGTGGAAAVGAVSRAAASLASLEAATNDVASLELSDLSIVIGEVDS